MITTEKKPPTARQLAGRQRAAETAKKKSAQRKELLERLVTACSGGDPLGEASKVVDEWRRLNRPPLKSRPERWSAAASTAESAVQELVDIQQEFSDWKDNLSENLQNSPVGEKLETICNIDLSSAADAVSEAAGADIPLGFGRD